MDNPLRFHPFLRPMVWGGRRLKEVLGHPVSGDEPHGESWMISDHALHHSVTAAGPWAGRSLRELMEQEREVLLGPASSAHVVFPWLVKFLDAHDWLSVQVHPNEEAVQYLLPGEKGKTEAWFILDAAPGSRIYAGLLPDVDEKRVRAALAKGTVADCLYQFEPKPGDFVFLPAGTVHAVGGGVLMAEVQQTSDATFRLFDWNRRDAQGQTRPLHIEQTLACIDWQRGPVTPIRTTGSQPLVNCPYFKLEYMEVSEAFTWGGEGRLQAAIIVRGRARLENGEAVIRGQAWLLPAAMGPMHGRPEGDLVMLLCTLP